MQDQTSSPIPFQRENEAEIEQFLKSQKEPPTIGKTTVWFGKSLNVVSHGSKMALKCVDVFHKTMDLKSILDVAEKGVRTAGKAAEGLAQFAARTEPETAKSFILKMAPQTARSEYPHDTMVKLESELKKIKEFRALIPADQDLIVVALLNGDNSKLSGNLKKVKDSLFSTWKENFIRSKSREAEWFLQLTLPKNEARDFLSTHAHISALKGTAKDFPKSGKEIIRHLDEIEARLEEQEEAPLTKEEVHLLLNLLQVVIQKDPSGNFAYIISRFLMTRAFEAVHKNATPEITAHLSELHQQIKARLSEKEQQKSSWKGASSLFDRGLVALSFPPGKVATFYHAISSLQFEKAKVLLESLPPPTDAEMKTLLLSLRRLLPYEPQKELTDKLIALIQKGTITADVRAFLFEMLQEKTVPALQKMCEECEARVGSFASLIAMLNHIPKLTSSLALFKEGLLALASRALKDKTLSEAEFFTLLSALEMASKRDPSLLKAFSKLLLDDHFQAVKNAFSERIQNTLKMMPELLSLQSVLELHDAREFQQLLRMLLLSHASQRDLDALPKNRPLSPIEIIGLKNCLELCIQSPALAIFAKRLLEYIMSNEAIVKEMPMDLLDRAHEVRWDSYDPNAKI